MHIELKKWSLEDKHILAKICDEADRSYLSDRLPSPYTEADAVSWLEIVSEHEGKDGVFRAIVADGEIVGNISVEQKADVYRKDAEIGYMLLDAYRSKGIMTEAVRIICEEAFSTLDIIRITGLVYAPNIASQKVLEKNGFLKEGVQRSAVFKNNRVYDLWLYGKVCSPV
ncbi:acetyltransferase, GNAT family [Marvinbryantia formatexigens DSM 14469]|uniref:Acetyltransferase, GNAT family n=1 Tax=Marvinbryantia formatexigens DSM 14469 TaxID=478749 RepID=C6LAH6_9FIRM|nr:GNAT family protein [Marvinbryantia formatexigens]EET62583.1 acetyltransferase, GNAT family [Marvinbryantia formatexigens DSM 14469]UWO23261.1 GNAT family N-acetyltransferase [Marvinbryantia formatexigens DSM 14469]SDG61426.1 Protein N-acetyltransferase, RimJ/RimL family [Marvinbryantia formatexigens]